MFVSASGVVDHMFKNTVVFLFVYLIKSLPDSRFGELERLQSGTDLEFAPLVVFEFVAHISMTETPVVKKTVGIQILPDFIE